MASYILRQVSPRLYNVMLRRKKVGFVNQISGGVNAGKFVGGLNGRSERVVNATAKGCFHELTAIGNRISLCGKNDHALAEKKLAEHNARVVADARQQEKELNDLADMLDEATRGSTEITNALRRPVRLRSRKVRI